MTLQEKIIDYFGDGQKWGAEINHIHEPKRMGTAGSLHYLRLKINCSFICNKWGCFNKI